MSVGTAVSESEARRLARKLPDALLVEWATELAGSIAAKADTSQVKSQISRAAEAAAQSPAIKLFTAWVRYQWARPGSSQLWTTGAAFEGKESDVAHAVLRIVQTVEDRLKQSAPNADAMLVERATMHATARFLGFLRRAVVAASWKEARE